MPVKTGIQVGWGWIPAFAGMTEFNSAGETMSVSTVTAVGGKAHE
jgi:hypothetical protein